MQNDANIYQKMAAITAELQTVAKNLTVETAKGKGYKAVSERDIIDAVKPLEAKYGIYSYPVDRLTTAEEMLEQDTQYGKKTTFYTRLRTVYRFVNINNPDDFIETVVFSVGIDSQDKGDGKAMTYGDKYALMKAYKISTGDDPDQTASVDAEYTPSRGSFMTKGKAVDFSPTCAGCGASITDAEHDFSVKRYGKPLCRACQKKVTANGG